MECCVHMRAVLDFEVIAIKHLNRTLRPLDQRINQLSLSLSYFLSLIHSFFLLPECS